MASAIAMPTCSFCLSSSLSQSSNTRKQSIWNISNSAVSFTQVSDFHFSKWVPHLGLCQFSQWNGLKNLGISTPLLIVKMGRKGRYKGKGAYASLFGVGAPEALVIGVVALLVFGPKGLAEVARNLGKTLRAFQPTIRELQDVSREFRSTLEREIGLDDIQASNQNSYNSSISQNSSSPSPNSSSEASQKEIDPNGSLSSSKAYSSEDYLKLTEEQLKAASASQKQSEENASPSESQPEAQTVSQGGWSPEASSAKFGQVFFIVIPNPNLSYKESKNSRRLPLKTPSLSPPHPAQVTFPQYKWTCSSIHGDASKYNQLWFYLSRVNCQRR